MRTFHATLLCVLALTAAVSAHDLERTRIVLSFASDGSFTLDISHDPNWLLLRMESFAGGAVPPRLTPVARDARLSSLGGVVIDRVVLWVDGREIRPTSAEYLTAETTFRLRGQVPRDARNLRWLYGPVIDQYPLIVRRADGRTHIELIDGSNWSGTVNLAGQFNPTRFATTGQAVTLVAFFALILWWRTHRATEQRRIDNRSGISGIWGMVDASARGRLQPAAPLPQIAGHAHRVGESLHTEQREMQGNEARIP